MPRETIDIRITCTGSERTARALAIIAAPVYRQAPSLWARAHYWLVTSLRPEPRDN